MKIRCPINYAEDADASASEMPEGMAERKRIAGLDDATIARLAQQGSAAMREAPGSRLRFEAAWSGTWTAAPSGDLPPTKEPPIPQHWSRGRPKKKAPVLSQKLADRATFRKLCHEARHGNKVAKAAAQYTLKTKFGKSVP